MAISQNFGAWMVPNPSHGKFIVNLTLLHIGLGRFCAQVQVEESWAIPEQLAARGAAQPSLEWGNIMVQLS